MVTVLGCVPPELLLPELLLPLLEPLLPALLLEPPPPQPTRIRAPSEQLASTRRGRGKQRAPASPAKHAPTQPSSIVNARIGCWEAANIIAPLRAAPCPPPGPVPAMLATLIERLEVTAAPLGVTLAGVNLQLTPAGRPVQPRVTALLNPFCGVTVTVVVAGVLDDA